MTKYSESKDYKVIAVVMGSFFRNEHIRYMNRLEAASRKNHIKFIYFSSVSNLLYQDINSEGEKSIFDLCYISRFDAILLFSESYKDEATLKAFIRGANIEDVPVITVDKSLPGSSVDIRFNYEESFRMVINHMLECHDFNTIYFMAGSPGNSYSEKRLEIYKEEMTNHKKYFDDNSIYYGGFWEGPCIAAMDKMFNDFDNGHPVPDCIICANDSMAITVIEYLHNKGCKIPEDIAVSGLDGFELEEYFTPRITTGKTDYDLFTSILMEVLSRDLPSDTHLEDVLVPSKLQLGESCGCCKKDAKLAGFKVIHADAEFTNHLAYQLDCSQIVSNSGISMTFEDAMQIVPEKLEALGCKKFWFIANEDFANDTKTEIHEKDADYTDNLKFTEKMYVWSFDKDNYGFNEVIDFGDILPDLSEELDNSDTILILPIHTKGIALGYSVITFTPGVFFQTRYLTFINNFRNMLDLQYNRIHLFQVYITDSLTGLLNRSGFNKRLETIIANNSSEEIALISVDIQRLKEINDSWGHEEGDNAIIEVSKILSSLSDNAFCARIEGDQFMICIHGNNLNDAALELISSLNHQLEHRNQFTDKYYMISINTNYFVIQISSHTFDYILKKADDLLYSIQG